MHRIEDLVFLMSAVLYGFQQPVASRQLDKDKDKDVYAIYSLILTNPETSHGSDTNPRYLIAETTVPGVPETPCVAPPADRRSDFQEVLADYAKRKEKLRVLKRALSIRKPYVLLNAEQAEAFVKSRMQSQVPTDPPQVADDQFKDVADLFRLGDVYFNQKQTLALTFVSSWCGSLCGLWRWRVFEKLESGAWVERDWVGCSTIADANWALWENGPGLALRSSRKGPIVRRRQVGSAQQSPTGKRIMICCSGVNDCHTERGIVLTSRLSSAYQRRT